MTKEEKELLFRDLSGRLPYEVKVHYHYSRGEKVIDEDRVLETDDIESLKYDIDNPQDYWCEISWKPYLRPKSTLTKDEKEEIEVFVFENWGNGKIDGDGDYEISDLCDMSYVYTDYCFAYVDWLNAHHIDYRGLIEKGLALKAPEDMYK